MLFKVLIFFPLKSVSVAQQSFLDILILFLNVHKFFLDGFPYIWIQWSGLSRHKGFLITDDENLTWEIATQASILDLVPREIFYSTRI